MPRAQSAADPRKRERVSFEEAINEALLLQRRWRTLSKPQQIVLKAFYGLPLASREECDLWSAFQGEGEYDELGYLTGIRHQVPYVPKKYHQLWGLIGRRSGKTDALAGTILAYETTLGGHGLHIASKQEAICFFIAQKLEYAEEHLKFVSAILEDSPLLSKDVEPSASGAIVLKTGIKIVPQPPALKTGRGLAAPGCVMDEVGFWYSDSDSANPDFEVERAVSWAQAQFPDWFRLGITTPYTKEGLAYKYHKAGSEGRKLPADVDRTEFGDILVIESPGAAMLNPALARSGRAFFIAERARDVEAFERESLARFTDSVSGFLKAELLDKAVDPGVIERDPLPRKDHPQDLKPFYIAAIDPAFRSDSFTFTIVHHDPQRGIVQDLVREFKAELGKRLNPADVLDTIKFDCDAYKVKTLYSDQYQLESLQQLALDRQLAIEGVDFTNKSKAKIFGSFKKLLDQGRMRLLDGARNPVARRMHEQLGQLEKRLTGLGHVQISAPQGKHDDLACVTALAAFKAVWMLPHKPAEAPREPVLSHVQRGIHAWQRRAQTGPGDRNWD